MIMHVLSNYGYFEGVYFFGGKTWGESFFMSSRTWPNGLLRLGTLQGEGDGMVDGRIVWGVLVGWVCWVCWLGVLVEEKMIFGPTLLHFSKKTS